MARLEFPSEEYGTRIIDTNEIYYVGYGDEKREMTDKEREEYDQIRALPPALALKEIYFLDPAKNPKFTPMKGSEIADKMSQGYLVVFPIDFAQSRKLMLITPDGTDFFLEHSTKFLRRAKR